MNEKNDTIFVKLEQKTDTSFSPKFAAANFRRFIGDGSSWILRGNIKQYVKSAKCTMVLQSNLVSFLVDTDELFDVIGDDPFLTL